jgi:hypothetical protein
MRLPRPFVVRQHGRLIFTVHAPSLAAARAIVASRLPDMTGIKIVAGAQR